jgi:RHS repeat-associated protein
VNKYRGHGNRWQQTANGSRTPGTASCITFDANNHVAGGILTYDAAGNVTADNMHHYTCDAQNHLTQVDAGTTAAYLYDGSGQRVQKTSAGTSVNYLYNLTGQVVTELSSTGSWNRGEVYAAGRHLATYRNGLTYFSSVDALGSERVRSTQNESSYESCVSLPFGDDQTCFGPGTGGISPLHFTGKERDTESGNDYFGARYYASSMGRWMSPDKPFADQHAGNPQSWNLYTYSLNNPLRFVDDDGREVKETRTTTYYTVSGATANDALGNANKHFSTPDGDHAGMTTANQSWSTSTSWTSTQSNGNITVTTTVTDDTITINQNVQLPQWDGYSQASPDEQKAWDTAVGQLQGHETQHEDINRAGADALDKSLPGTKASATGKDLDPTVKASQNNNNAAVQQKVDANQQTTNQNNQHLDACTNHGTQGCK